ncbi:hypothetical protein RV18_GL002133 [Enterococcus termitis]|nr:hypothetical protein RV18_GL002133 [Enterococcus termitis]
MKFTFKVPEPLFVPEIVSFSSEFSDIFAGIVTVYVPISIHFAKIANDSVAG